MNGLKRLTLLSKTAAVQKLVPRALWWFRWAALINFLAGAITLVSKGMHAGAGWIAIYSSSWGHYDSDGFCPWDINVFKCMGSDMA